MALQIGIVGLPNVGKSTLFKALTRKAVDIANYPFCTISPNVGVVTVPDERLDKLAAVSKSEKIIPTTIEFVDIAGLVQGASKGEGLGNQFLSHIREVDAIAEVVREFPDDNIIHVSGKVDPQSDVEVINLELILADLSVVSKRHESLQKQTKAGGEKTLLQTVDVLGKIRAALEAGKLASTVELTHEELPLLNEFNLLTRKPILYVRNVGENDLDKLQRSGGSDIYISAKLEAELADLSEDEAKAYLKELGLPESGLTRLIHASYQLLNLITFLTSGPKETRAWTVKRGAKAPEAAGVIHTDFQQGFIRAEVIGWQDFVAHGEHGAKEKGLMRMEGKDYVMRDGDVVHFHFS